MHLEKVFGALITAMVVCFVVIHCNSGSGNNDCDPAVEFCGECDPRVDICPGMDWTTPGCDPDGHYPCPDDWFICTNDDFGGKICEEQESATPPGDGWDCEEVAGVITCESDDADLPPDGSGWECSEYPDGSIVCRRHSYYPDMGGEEIWDCRYEGEFRICHSRGDEVGGGDADADGDGDGGLTGDGGSECPPGVEIETTEYCGTNGTGDGIDNDCDGRVDEDCFDDERACACNAGSWRYCDEPDFCLWGRQVCADDGLEWGPCVEITDIPEVCAAVEEWYSPSAERCCVEAGFCCQDMWDLNHNGDTWESLGNCEELVCVEIDSGDSGDDE